MNDVNHKKNPYWLDAAALFMSQMCKTKCSQYWLLTQDTLHAQKPRGSSKYF